MSILGDFSAFRDTETNVEGVVFAVATDLTAEQANRAGWYFLAFTHCDFRGFVTVHCPRLSVAIVEAFGLVPQFVRNQFIADPLALHVNVFVLREGMAPPEEFQSRLMGIGELTGFEKMWSDLIEPSAAEDGGLLYSPNTEPKP